MFRPPFVAIFMEVLYEDININTTTNLGTLHTITPHPYISSTNNFIYLVYSNVF